MVADHRRRRARRGTLPLIMARQGKIARLPKAIRDELNRRLANGRAGREVLAWLNALPETQAVLAEFDGKPISDPNLTRWRHLARS